MIQCQVGDKEQGSRGWWVKTRRLGFFAGFFFLRTLCYVMFEGHVAMKCFKLAGLSWELFAKLKCYRSTDAFLPFVCACLLSKIVVLFSLISCKNISPSSSSHRLAGWAAVIVIGVLLCARRWSVLEKVRATKLCTLANEASFPIGQLQLSLHYD